MPNIDTTRLEAINTMLSLIGEAPVNSLENAGSADVAMAIRTLDEEDRQLQSNGWHWNTDRDKTITADSLGRFAWVSDWIRFDVDRGRFAKSDVDPVRRGDFMWNLAKSTDVFAQDSLTGSVVRYLEWEDMPETARNFVMVRAGRIFLNRTMGDQIRSGYATADEQAAWRILIDAEDEQGDFSYQETSFPRAIRRKQSTRFPFAN